MNITVTFQGLHSFPSRAHPVSLAARLADSPHRPRPRSFPSSQVLLFINQVEADVRTRLRLERSEVNVLMCNFP